MPDVHIYAPKPMSCTIRWLACYGCKHVGYEQKRSPMIVTTFEWFDPSATCLRCGENLGIERPFAPGWRAASVKSARQRAVSAGLRVPKLRNAINCSSRRRKRPCPR